MIESIQTDANTHQYIKRLSFSLKHTQILYLSLSLLDFIDNFKPKLVWEARHHMNRSIPMTMASAVVHPKPVAPAIPEAATPVSAATIPTIRRIQNKD